MTVKNFAEVVVSYPKRLCVRTDTRNRLCPPGAFRILIMARLTHGMTSDTDISGLQHLNRSLSKSFSDALSKARGDRSQAEFARMLGIANQQTYQRYEAGLVPGGIVLYHIATRLGVTVDQLLTGGKVHEGAKALASEKAVLWASELQDAVHFQVAVTTFAKTMTAAQLVAAVSDIVSNNRLPDKAKIFWTRLLAEWVLVKTEVEKGLGTHEEFQDMAKTNIKHCLASGAGELKSDDMQSKQLSLMNDLRMRLAKLTEKRGAQAALAREFGVSPQAVHQWITGNSAPEAETVLRLYRWANSPENKSKGSDTGATASKPQTQPKATDESKPQSGRKKR